MQASTKKNSKSSSSSPAPKKIKREPSLQAPSAKSKENSLFFFSRPPQKLRSLLFFPAARTSAPRLESKRPLSKKLISLNIILGASAGRKHLPPPAPTSRGVLRLAPPPQSSFNFLMRKCFQRAAEKYYGHAISYTRALKRMSIWGWLRARLLSFFFIIGLTKLVFFYSTLASFSS